MNCLDIVSTGNAFAEARLARGMIASSINLRSLRCLEEAEEVQLIANHVFGGQPVGYTLSGTSQCTAGILHCEQPVLGRMFAETIIPSGDSLEVTPAMVGIGAELVFVFGRSYPQNDAETVDLATLSNVIVACRLGLQVMARRVPHTTAINRKVATADFGLAEVQVQGAVVQDWQKRLLMPWSVNLLVDSHLSARGATNQCMGHPLAPVLWMCRQRGASSIEAGDSVAVGSCTGLAQMVPGHVIEGDFGELGKVTLRLR